MRRSARFAALCAIVLLTACGGGSVAGNHAPFTGFLDDGATLILRIAIATPYASPVALMSVTTHGQGSVTTAQTLVGCAPAGCTVRAKAPLDFVDVTVQPMAADATVLDTGRLLANVPALGRKTMNVAFGATPAVYHLSLSPASITIGSPSIAKLSFVARDASQEEIIGSAPLPAPIAISGTGSGYTLSAQQFTTIGDTIDVAYDGSVTHRVRFTGNAGSTTASGATLFAVRAPHAILGGIASGDASAPSVQRILTLPTAPPVPPPIGGRTASSARRAVQDLGTLFPPIGDQGQSDSCTTWSSSYAIRSYFFGLRTGVTFTGSGPGGINTDAVFSPQFAFSALDNGANIGLDPTNVLNFLTQYGGVSWTQMPFSDTTFGPPPATSLLAAGAVNPFYDLGTIDNSDVTSMKAWLDAGYPIWWIADIDDNFEVLGPFQTWTGGGNPEGVHALVITAYDDTNQRFTVRNSWGFTWGLRGTGFVSYAQWQAASVLNVVLSDQPSST